MSLPYGITGFRYKFTNQDKTTEERQATTTDAPKMKRHIAGNLRFDNFFPGWSRRNNRDGSMYINVGCNHVSIPLIGNSFSYC